MSRHVQTLPSHLLYRRQPFLNINLHILFTSVLDYFHVMTYDFNGPWEHTVGENSPLYKGPADQGSMIYFNVVSNGSCCKFIRISCGTGAHIDLYALMCRTMP